MVSGLVEKQVRHSDQMSLTIRIMWSMNCDMAMRIDFFKIDDLLHYKTGDRIVLARRECGSRNQEIHTYTNTTLTEIRQA